MHAIGPKSEIFESIESVDKIFDVLWSGITEAIWDETIERKEFDISIDDINLMLASMLVMGLNVQPSAKDYFNQSDSRGIFGCEWLIDRFTRTKWHDFNNRIHFKPRQVMKLLRNNFQNSWNLHQQVVVDETIIPFTGQWKYIQHVRNKPHNTGLKFYCLADNARYLWDFWLYTGEESERRHKPDEIVMDFVANVERLQNRSTHIMITDSYYGSLKLIEWLHAAKWGALISCKADRPSFLFSSCFHKNIKKKDVVGADNKKFSAITYFDKAKVNIITNLFDGFPLVRNRHNQLIPRAIQEYRSLLGSVDQFDRWLHQYLPQHRNIKWTQALLCGLLKMTINNTLIISMQKSISFDLKEVTLKVIDHLAGNYTTKKQFRSNKWKKAGLHKHHYPIEVEKKGHCAYCQAQKRDSSTKFKCTGCNIYLHPKCWINFHV